MSEKMEKLAGLHVDAEGRVDADDTSNADRDDDGNVLAVDDAGHVLAVNASGHVQELDRNFGLLSAASMGIVTGSVWPALGGSVLVAIYNGGPPGIIYEFIASTVCYLSVYIAIAELASALPSSAGVYHWATVGAGRYGKAVGFFAGCWNTAAWVFGAAAICNIAGTIVCSMYALYHPEYSFERWNVFIVYVILCLSAAAFIAFGNRYLPLLNRLGFASIVIGGLATVLTLAIVPKTEGGGYASSATVWKDWVNGTGYGSNGFVFLAGMLNGSFAVGTPDVLAHMAEEIPRPQRNIPRAMLLQLAIGFATGLVYIIALLYSVHDYDAIFEAAIPFPVGAIYLQATQSRGGALALLILFFIPILCTMTGALTTACRTLWTLGRDDAAPFGKWLGKVDKNGHNPRNATYACAGLCIAFGAIYAGSQQAFSAIVGSFVVLSMASYLAAILPSLFTSFRHLRRGPFFVPGFVGVAVRAFACAYMLAFIVIFCFPYALPVEAPTMNYTSAIVGGLTVIFGIWYGIKLATGYARPVVARMQRV